MFLLIASQVRALPAVSKQSALVVDVAQLDANRTVQHEEQYDDFTSLSDTESTFDRSWTDSKIGSWVVTIHNKKKYEFEGSMKQFADQASQSDCIDKCQNWASGQEYDHPFICMWASGCSTIGQQAGTCDKKDCWITKKDVSLDLGDDGDYDIVTDPNGRLKVFVYDHAPPPASPPPPAPITTWTNIAHHSKKRCKDTDVGLSNQNSGSNCLEHCEQHARDNPSTYYQDRNSDEGKGFCCSYSGKHKKCRMSLDDGGINSAKKKYWDSWTFRGDYETDSYTCRFTIDNEVTDVYLDDKKVTSQVEGTLNRWESTKVLTFDGGQTKLKICGKEWDTGTNDFQAASGFLLACTGSRSAWGSVVSDTSWQAKAYNVNNQGKFTTSKTDAFMTPVESTSGFHCDGLNGCGKASSGESPTKIWARKTDAAYVCFTKEI